MYASSDLPHSYVLVGIADGSLSSFRKQQMCSVRSDAVLLLVETNEIESPAFSAPHASIVNNVVKNQD
jgi:hypothetical protein